MVEWGRSPHQKNLETGVIIQVYEILKLPEDRIENGKYINIKKLQVAGAAGFSGPRVAPEQTHPAWGREVKQPVRLHWDARAFDKDCWSRLFFTSGCVRVVDLESFENSIFYYQ